MKSSSRSLLAVVIVALAGCVVSGDEVLASISACEKHGGIWYVNAPWSGYSVRCMDGTLIQGPIPK